MRESEEARDRRHLDFRKEIAAEEQRRAEGKGSRGEFWFGLGMMGLVGWSVAIPTLIGLGLGMWIDSKLGDRISWTLTGLAAGVALGAGSAWYWISHEQKEANRDDSSPNDATQ